MPGPPHMPAGTPAGGQFMSYDSKSKQGTGYSKKGGDANVRRLQSALNRLGLSDGKGNRLSVDGRLGPLTTQAVKRAQRALGVKADGRVTPALLAKIEAMPKPSAAAKPKPAAPQKRTARALMASRQATR